MPFVWSRTSEPLGRRARAAGTRAAARLAVPALLLALGGCGSGDGEAPDEVLACRSFRLGGTDYAIRLPEVAEVRASGDAAVEIWPLAGGRRMRFLRLTVSADGRVPESASRMTLPGVGELAYAVEADLGGGSGGTEGELRGALTLSAPASGTLGIVCHDQQEGTPDPHWCLDRLAGLVRGSSQCRDTP